MGLFDTIIAKCPKCGQPSEFQTKSGFCLLREYTLEDCPDDALLDANRHSPNKCESCGCYFDINIHTRQTEKE
jgi:hypothetical protein